MVTQKEAASSAYEVHQKKGMLWFGFLVLLSFVVLAGVVSFEIVQSGDYPSLFLFGSVFLVGLFLTYTLGKRLFGSSVLLRLETEHMVLFHFGKSPIAIPWSEVEQFVLYHYQRQPLIGLVLRNESRYIEGLPLVQKMMVKGNQKMGFPAFNFALKGIKEPEELLEGLQLTGIPFDGNNQ